MKVTPGLILFLLSHCQIQSIIRVAAFDDRSSLPAHDDAESLHRNARAALQCVKNYVLGQQVRVHFGLRIALGVWLHVTEKFPLAPGAHSSIHPSPTHPSIHSSANMSATHLFIYMPMFSSVESIHASIHPSISPASQPFTFPLVSVSAIPLFLLFLLFLHPSVLMDIHYPPSHPFVRLFSIPCFHQPVHSSMFIDRFVLSCY